MCLHAETDMIATDEHVKMEDQIPMLYYSQSVFPLVSVIFLSTLLLIAVIILTMSCLGPKHDIVRAR